MSLEGSFCWRALTPGPNGQTTSAALRSRADTPLNTQPKRPENLDTRNLRIQDWFSSLASEVVLLDIISIILGSIGVLQNIRAQSSLEEKISTMKDGAAQISLVHGFLKNAKHYHDSYEKFSIRSFRPFVATKATFGHIPENDRLEIIRQFESSLRNSLNLSNLDQYNISQIPDAQHLPIRDEMRNLARHYPELCAAVKDHESHINACIEQITDRNFGNHFDDSLRQIETHNDRVITSADNVILCSIPIVEFLHYTLSTSIEDLS